MKPLESFYKKENIKYRQLRYCLLVYEAKPILKWLFQWYRIKEIPCKFQQRVKWKGEYVVGVFLAPEYHYSLQLRFEKEDMELLTILHEFTHYLYYTKHKWKDYKNVIHGKGFYRELDKVIQIYKKFWEPHFFEGVDE
jgi:hypothetical protein